MRTLFSSRKSGQSVFFAQRAEFVVASGKKLVSVALMAYIPDNCVMRTVEYAVKRNRQFNDTEIACKVAAVLSNCFYNCFSDFFCKNRELVFRNFFYICW